MSIFSVYTVFSPSSYMFRVFVSLAIFFTFMETSPLPVKECKFLPTFGSFGHLTVRVL